MFKGRQYALCTPDAGKHCEERREDETCSMNLSPARINLSRLKSGISNPSMMECGEDYKEFGDFELYNAWQLIQF